MIVFTTNENNDIFLDNTNNLSISRELSAVLLACETAVQAQLGEMVFAIEDGIPNFPVIWNGSPNIAQAEASIRSTLLKVDNVLDVTSIDSVVNDNTFRYNATISTTFGQGVIENGI